MEDKHLRNLLERTAAGTVSIDQALIALRDLPYEDLGHTKVDHHRQLRNGFPEVVYGEGKTPEQVTSIFTALRRRGNVLVTRASEASAAAVLESCPNAIYNPVARTITFEGFPLPKRNGTVGIVTAGTSDLPVAEEAQVTSTIFGNPTKLYTDVGVAGIHRLFDRLDELREAAVLIVVAGMEGALASVVAGMVERPVIAVPTSVGYGASFQGLAALLGMLTSCASGISVVNIDNGFGAACAATRMNPAITESEEGTAAPKS
jgi:NCAIR mutase (PurE)-related protein